jgi:hypothetical protein
MKSSAQPVIWTERDWPRAGVSVGERREIGKVARAVTIESEAEAMVCRRTTSGSLSTPLRIVGVLAFCQALVFVVLFLFICARAGASTVAKPTSSLELNPSTYLPQKGRDPFGAEVAKTADGTTTTARVVTIDMLKLQGILYNKVNPSALVNDQLVELNKTTKVHTDQGEVQVKALEITRELVLLDVGGQKIELRLGGSERNPTAK